MSISVQRAFILFAAAMFGASCFGQGIIHFQNRDPSVGIDAPVYWSFVPPIKVDGADPLFRAALLGGPENANVAGPGWVGELTMLASPTTGATWVGFLSGPDAGYLNVGDDTARVLSNVAPGLKAHVQVVAWYGNYTSWEAAVMASWSDPSVRTAASQPMLIHIPSDPNEEVKLQALWNFDFTIIPEPSAGMLFALLIFFWLRRWKRERAPTGCGGAT